MQIKAIFANGKAKSHKVLKGAPSLRAWSLLPAVREIGKRNAEGLSSEARLKEYPCAERDDSFRHAFGVFHRLNPPQAAMMENVPRRGRSWGGLENGVAEERRDTVSLPYNHKLIPRAKELRKDATEQEKCLWYKYLSQYPIRFQRQKTIGRFIADFYCAKAKLAIELDGSQHFSNEGKAYDESRTAGLEEYGITVIRFSNAEVDRHFESVCEVIDKTVRALIKEI